MTWLPIILAGLCVFFLYILIYTLGFQLGRRSGMKEMEKDYKELMEIEEERYKSMKDTYEYLLKLRDKQ